MLCRFIQGTHIKTEEASERRSLIPNRFPSKKPVPIPFLRRLNRSCPASLFNTLVMVSILPSVFSRNSANSDHQRGH